MQNGYIKYIFDVVIEKGAGIKARISTGEIIIPEAEIGIFRPVQTFCLFFVFAFVVLFVFLCYINDIVTKLPNRFMIRKIGDRLNHRSMEMVKQKHLKLI